MRKRKGMTVLSALVCILLIGAFTMTGYVLNLVKLCRCDFASPIKAEVVRGIGVVVPPVGVVAGYINIEDGEIKD